MAIKGGVFSGNLSTFPCRGEPILIIKQQEELIKSIGKVISKTLKEGTNGHKHWKMPEQETRMCLQESLCCVVW